MKKIILASSATLLFLSSCSKESNQQTVDQSQDDGCSLHGPSCNHESHNDDEASDDGTTGPNGGRMLEFDGINVEFVVTEDHSIILNYFDPELQPIAPVTGDVKVTTGEAISPVTILFKAENDSLVSISKLPEGNKFPTKVDITVGGKTQSDTFTLNHEASKH